MSTHRPPPPPPPLPLRAHLQSQLKKCTEARSVAGHSDASSPSSDVQGNADAAGGAQDAAAAKAEDGEDSPAPRKNAPMEMVLARLLTDTLASLTRTFEKNALLSGEVSGSALGVDRGGNS